MSNILDLTPPTRASRAVPDQATGKTITNYYRACPHAEHVLQPRSSNITKREFSDCEPSISAKEICGQTETTFPMATNSRDTC